MHETNDIHFFALYPLLTSQISEQYIAKNNLFSFLLLWIIKWVIFISLFPTVLPFLLTRTFPNKFIMKFFERLEMESQHSKKNHLGCEPKPTENFFFYHNPAASFFLFFFHMVCSIFLLNYYFNWELKKTKLASFLSLSLVRSSCPFTKKLGRGRMCLQAKTFRELHADWPWQPLDTNSFKLYFVKITRGERIQALFLPFLAGCLEGCFYKYFPFDEAHSHRAGK